MAALEKSVTAGGKTTGGSFMIAIKEAATNMELKRFILFPCSLYEGNPFCVPALYQDELNTLRKDRNPAFEYCEAKYWLAYKDGKLAGRIAGIINRQYISIWGKKYARFGWIDFIDDPEVAKALLATVEAWAKENGLEGVHGPMGFCDMDSEGMLVEGFDEPGTMITLYNHPYYPRYLESFGYDKDVDWVEYELKVPREIPEKVDRLAQIVLKRMNLHIVQAKKPKELRPYAHGIFELLNDAYKNLYGVVPLTQRQIDQYIKQYFSFIDPDFVRIILDDQGNIAAFGIAMPSLTKALQKAKGNLFPFGFLHILQAMKKNTCLDLYLVAVRPDLQGKGVNALLLNEITKACIRRGVRTAESNPELESNEKVQAQWKFFETRQHKRRRCYIKVFKQDQELQAEDLS
jgi:GNAT superfamily N-acetyltransferase